MRSSRPGPAVQMHAVWAARVAWVAAAAAGAWSIGSALAGHAALLRWCVGVPAWALWGVGVVALVVPSATGLTVSRLLAVLGVATAATAWAGGASIGPSTTFAGSSVVFTVVAMSADFGQHCVRASAYGDERRFVLRPPVHLLLPVAVAATLWAAVVVAAPLMLGARRWIIGSALACLAVVATVVVLPRFHALARRWVVLVPAGIVLHDHVVLAETLMVSKREVLGVNLALADTEAADLTGPAAGHAVEIGLAEMVTATLAPTRATPRGTTLHMQAFLVAPSRPGAFLTACLGTPQVAMPPPST